MIRKIIMDLDGTLYQDTKIYPRLIDFFFQGTPFEPLITDVKALETRVLQGKESVRLGGFVPKETLDTVPKSADELLNVPFVPLCEADPAVHFDRKNFSHIGEGWSLSMYLGHRIGLYGDEFWQRFRPARQDLLSAEYGPAPDDALRDVLLSLRKKGTHLCLCSSSKEPDAMALLAHLHLLDCFDETHFDFEKPFGYKELPLSCVPDEMLFVGDQGYGDLMYAKSIGAHTLLINPCEVQGADEWDMRVRTIGEMTEKLMNL